MKKFKKTLQIFASALAGAYFLLLAVCFCGFSGENQAFAVAYPEGKEVLATAHPREKLASYTTYFSQNDGGRCENIRLAAASLNGIALQPYGELSFNGVVGPRTAKNGYKTAKIIVQGEFVDGVGGGVCQVSTTLYNAALLSGLTVLESYPHSLRVGYVPPSRDAMVSSRNDLRLYNPYSETVYLSTSVEKGSIRVTFYGKPTEYTYAIESRTLAEIPPPPNPSNGQGSGGQGSNGRGSGGQGSGGQGSGSQGSNGRGSDGRDLQGKTVEYLRPPVSGLKSEAYLKTYQNGVLISIRRLRSDVYAPQAGVLREKN